MTQPGEASPLTRAATRIRSRERDPGRNGARGDRQGFHGENSLTG